MGNFNAPFRFDYVGSFLRPVHLKQARADFEAGQITKAELESIENEAITNLIKKTESCRIPCHHRRRIPQKLLASGFYVGT